jgi:hypothetical protein
MAGRQSASRRRALVPWLRYYDCRQSHDALNHIQPISRLQEAFVTAVAVGFAVVCLRAASSIGMMYDALEYFALAQKIWHGEFASWQVNRTYGYPLFLALCSGLQEVSPDRLRILAFWGQLGVHLGAAFLVSRRLGRAFRSSNAARLAFAIAALNPVLLAHTAECLSDLLSAIAVVVAVALSWRADEDGAAPRAVVRRAAISLFCAAFAAMIRPVNVMILLAVAVSWAIRSVVWRDVPRRTLLYGLVAGAAAFLPQIVLNYGITGAFNPLLARSHYSSQLSMGMSALRYDTVVVEGVPPWGRYANPFYQPVFHRPLDFWRADPAGYALTLLLHAFAMGDHTHAFTYVTELRPWYRWPLSALNYLLGYLALVGLVLGLWRTWRRRGVDEVGFVLLSTALAGAAYLAVHLPVLVETRFSLPLHGLATPFVVFALRHAAVRSAENRGMVWWLVLGGLVFVALCASLSMWIARQAPWLAA